MKGVGVKGARGEKHETPPGGAGEGSRLTRCVPDGTGAYRLVTISRFVGTQAGGRHGVADCHRADKAAVWPCRQASSRRQCRTSCQQNRCAMGSLKDGAPGSRSETTAYG